MIPEIQLPDGAVMDTAIPIDHAIRIFVAYSVSKDAYGNSMPGTTAFLEVIVPMSEKDYLDLVGAHVDKMDPRDLCLEFRTRFHGSGNGTDDPERPPLRGAIEPGIFDALRTVGYPAVMDPMEIPLPDGTIVPPREYKLLRINTAACKPGSPHSVLLEYIWEDLPHVVIPIPEILVGRQACGVCEGCKAWHQKAEEYLEEAKKGHGGAHQPTEP